MNECPICQSKLLSLMRLKGSRTGQSHPLYLCIKCTSFFQRPNYHEDNDALLADLQWHIDKSQGDARRCENIIDSLLTNNPKIKTALDIGCGVGTTILAFQERDIHCSGIEPNPYAVKYAKEHFALDLQLDYFSANLFKEKFDAVVIDMVLEHIPLLDSFIRDVFSILNPGGVIFLAVPGLNWNILRSSLRIILKRIDIDSTFADNDVHINHFSRNGIKKLIKPHHAVIQQELWPGECIIRQI